MADRFVVLATPHFRRLSLALARRHPAFEDIFAKTLARLSADPYNRSEEHRIAKLKGNKHEWGQYRLRSGRFRFRYNIEGTEVILEYCGLRDEDTYR